MANPEFISNIGDGFVGIIVAFVWMFGGGLFIWWIVRGDRPAGIVWCYRWLLQEENEDEFEPPKPNPSRHSSFDLKDKAKEKLSKIHLPKIQFKDSGWVLVYVICGWICCVGGIIILFVGLASDHKDSDSEAFIYFCSALLASLSCFFGAHVLRLQEKTAHHAEKIAHHAERTADAIERLEKKTKDE